MTASFYHAPRLVVSGLAGGSGKTLVSLGLCRALSRTGVRVKPYKKGPDYIDAAWLALASGNPTTNLDPFFLSDDRLRALFHTSFTQADLALIEGNRGLYDGRDTTGSCSTAVLARLLDAPILLALNVTKMTRTAAAVIAGLAAFEPVHLAGVVLNQVGSTRHAAIIRQAVETYTDIPVLGALPRLKENPIPERHMGLISMYSEEAEQSSLHASLDTLADFLTEHTDIDTIRALADAAPALPCAQPFWPDFSPNFSPDFSPEACAGSTTPPASASASDLPPERLPVASSPHASASPAPATKPTRRAAPRIGFVRDAALWFYYEENLEALRRAGATLIPLSLLDPKPWPALDGVYLGGGFPEMVAERLSQSPQLAVLRHLSAQGMPIYAECGGFMVLCESLLHQGIAHPMAGIFPAQAVFCARPQGLGYVEATVVQENPFHPLHSTLRGHEFHYSRCEPQGTLHATLQLHGGLGMSGQATAGQAAPASGHVHALPKGADGLLIRNTFAAYTHLFAPAVPHWASQFVQLCQQVQE